jgi:opacity protein-like surface antigen
MKTRQQAALLGTALLAAAPLHASEWKHELAPYLWGTAMDGTAATGPLEAEVDVSFGDILDNLEVGFMGAYRATRDQWSVTVDSVYMELGSWGRGPAGYVKADVDLDQLAIEVDVGYEVMERLILLAGLRYNDLSVDLKATGPLGTSSASQAENWLDPVIGAIYTVPFAEKWSLNLRGDVGGFGIGSDFAWQGMASVRWQASERVGVAAAYRYIDMDYDNGKDADYFKYDMSISGPALGVVFTF